MPKYCAYRVGVVDRIRLIEHDAASGRTMKAIVHLTPERAFVFECWQEPADPATGTYNILIADPSRGHRFMRTFDVGAGTAGEAIVKAARAAVLAWEEATAFEALFPAIRRLAVEDGAPPPPPR